MAQTPTPGTRSLKLELLIVTVSLLVVAHILFLARGTFIGPAISTVIAVLFLYAPIFVLWKRGRRIDFLDRGAGEYLRSIVTFFVAAVIIFPPFFVLAHFWQVLVFKAHWNGLTHFSNPFTIIIFQLLLIALPEEFYFRGYFQSTMDVICKKRWRILGVNLGWSWIITAAVFAVAHSIVRYQWWHFAIFFPALVFGYLRERTGTITAPVLFHAASNVLMNWFASCYV